MRILLLAALLGLAGGAEAGPRSEVPIRSVVLDNGNVLYSIAIKIGGTQIEAGLDTGSAGIRILPGTLAAGDVTAEGSAPDANFSSGVRYQGELASANVGIGDLSGKVTLEDIKSIGCSAARPDCPATRTGPADYGVRGNSLTAGRFRAIVGINTAGGRPASPLAALGVKRWIVELPRPGETGKLILDPGDDEVKDFVRLRNPPTLERRGGLRDAVTGCIIEGRNRLCGPLLLDSGAPSLRLAAMGANSFGWDRGTSVTLGFYDGETPRALETLVLGHPEQGSNLAFDARAAMPFGVIFAGTAPYLAFDVLYDPGQRQLGLKARPPLAGMPQGRTGN